MLVIFCRQRFGVSSTAGDKIKEISKITTRICKVKRNEQFTMALSQQ